MATSGSTVIRVFLSSTFVDFQEERSLLVKQVFPSLRRRARSRGVDIVDVDLRWGVTAEQTERGETLPLCLAEIDRCRPYFISLLGERYGWVPPADTTYYKPALLERQPWLQERMGAASLTELEILHGVLRNPEMAGHAFFYLRDPIYAQAQSEPGWMADHPAEQQRLDALKEEVRRSGFPVCEGLATPQAIAEQIEADLWAVIEREHPEQEPLDPLQREAQRHSDYRRARTGLYLGGESAIAQLEEWIESGEQRILITGESGSGKSALIANWLEAHSKSAPQDLVHAHHLGCTNDASAVRPMLARLIDTASQLLLAEQQIAEPLKVPQDWWELIFKVGEVFALLSSWCERQGGRWILVLDGLDRLADDDQQAVPWIPTTLPSGIHVVASALDCRAKTLLQERNYCIHKIAPLGKAEQLALIERYLNRYTKQLERGLQRRILKHTQASSPLFLRVLLEELRQCAWFDTLENQLDFYLSAQTTEELYLKILERLDGDGHSKATHKALTAIWASRAGLNENEILEIARITYREWAPVELSLEKCLGKCEGRVFFENDYLRSAVSMRYLLEEKKVSQAANLIVGHLMSKKQVEYSALDWMELFWQFRRLRTVDCYFTVFFGQHALLLLIRALSPQQVLQYWSEACRLTNKNKKIEEAISPAVGFVEINLEAEGVTKSQIDLLNLLQLLKLDDAGSGPLGARICNLYLQTCKDQRVVTPDLLTVKEALADFGRSKESRALYMEVRAAYEANYPNLIFDILRISVKCAKISAITGSYQQSMLQCKEVRLLTDSHQAELSPMHKIQLYTQLADVYRQFFKDKSAVHLLEKADKMCDFYLGRQSLEKLRILMSLISLSTETRRHQLAIRCNEAFDICKNTLGLAHPLCITCQENLVAMTPGKHKLKAKLRLLELKKFRFGVNSSEYLFAWACLGVYQLRHGMTKESLTTLAACYHGHCSHFGEELEPTLAVCFYYSIACMLCEHPDEGLRLFSRSMMIPLDKLKQTMRSMGGETAERIDDLSGFYGHAFAGSMDHQRKEVVQLIVKALDRGSV